MYNQCQIQKHTQHASCMLIIISLLIAVRGAGLTSPAGKKNPLPWGLLAGVNNLWSKQTNKQMVVLNIFSSERFVELIVAYSLLFYKHYGMVLGPYLWDLLLITQQFLHLTVQLFKELVWLLWISSHLKDFWLIVQLFKDLKDLLMS